MAKASVRRHSAAGGAGRPCKGTPSGGFGLLRRASRLLRPNLLSPDLLSPNPLRPDLLSRGLGPLRLCGVTLACLALPGLAMACALPPSIILTLPSGYYILAAALCVALTAFWAVFTPVASGPARRLLLNRRALLPEMAGSWCGAAATLALLLIGYFGDRDPMHNLLTLVFWIGIWVALPLASMLFGDLWRRLSPWRGPVRLARRLLGRHRGIGLARFGHWPAVLGLAAFSWFQLISTAPQDPAVLARLAALYAAVILVLGIAEGEEWLDQAEFLTVMFALLARVAPLWRQRLRRRIRLYAGPPGAQLALLPPPTLALQAFVTLLLAGLSFDGLSETFFWHALIGQNPLEPIGRSGVAGVNTCGLLACWALTLGLVWAALRLGRLAPGPVFLSLMVIAAGYHAAHHLVSLMGSGQYLLEALNDPLHQGAALLGLGPHFVSMGFLADPQVMQLIYACQFMAILLAHLLALRICLRPASGPASISASKPAATSAAAPSAAIRGLSHLPMALLMLGYTCFGLWLLSTARVG